jgi:hypothetical protein
VVFESENEWKHKLEIAAKVRAKPAAEDNVGKNCLLPISTFC